MKVHVAIVHGKACQSNSHSLVLASEVAWVPCDLDRRLFNPRCCSQSYNTRSYPVDINYKERNNKYTRIKVETFLILRASAFERFDMPVFYCSTINVLYTNKKEFAVTYVHMWLFIHCF